MFEWIAKNYVELISAVSGLVYIYFSVRQNIWLWPWGIITSAFSMIVFFNSKVYANMALQAYYVFISVYGWFIWHRGIGGQENKTELPVKRINTIKLVVLTLLSVLLFAVLYWLLSHYLKSQHPGLDSFTSALSIIATWMLAHKLLENWLVWIIVDAIIIALCIVSHKYLLSVLYAVYTVLAIIGYYEWKKDLKPVKS